MKALTEVEWLTCERAPVMLLHMEQHLRPLTRSRNGLRKLRLFACACCRRCWHLLSDETSRRAVETMERYVDGKATRKEMAAIRQAVLVRQGEVAVASALWSQQPNRNDAKSGVQMRLAYFSNLAALTLVQMTGIGMAKRLARETAELAVVPSRTAKAHDETSRLETYEQCHLLRDVVGNPYRNVVVEPGWLQWNYGTVGKLAQAVYEDRDFDRLPILADALEEAGCDNTDILAHCRSQNAHVRGCFLVDALLQKA